MRIEAHDIILRESTK